MPSLGLATNIYNDANALPGLLELASGYFDDIVFLHAGPQGAYSTDGTIEIIEKWGCRIVYGSIDEGFGVVRTRAIHLPSTEWVAILDTDERFYPLAPVLRCDANLNVVMDGEPYNQGAWLRSLLNWPNIDAICTIRRHWHDFTWKRPTQNWHAIPDYQLRIVRNIPEVHYASQTRMHEHCIDSRTGQNPRYRKPEFPHGPFHDHFHLHYKAMEPEQRLHDIQIYDAIHEGRIPPTEEEFRARKAVTS